jgi:hypothetical protein
MNGQELEELRDRLQDVNVEVFRALRSQQEEIAELKLRLDGVPALVEAYRKLHAQTCDDYWADDECACGGRQLLARWEKP